MTGSYFQQVGGCLQFSSFLQVSLLKSVFNSLSNYTHNNTTVNISPLPVTDDESPRL